MKTRTVSGRDLKKQHEHGKRGIGTVAWDSHDDKKQIQSAIEMIRKRQAYGPGTIVNMVREASKRLPDFWASWAELFEFAFDEENPVIKWGEEIWYATGESVTYDSFEDFYTNECEAFLGPYDELKELLRQYRLNNVSDDQARRYFEEINRQREVVAENPEGAPPVNPWGRGGKPKNVLDNVQDNKAPTGNSQAATLRRIIRTAEGHATPRTPAPTPEKQQQAQELLSEIKAGAMSANAAAIALGFRKKKTPPENAIHWLARCDDEQLAEVVLWLKEKFDGDIPW